MASAPTLDQLPAEISERIFEHLGLENLRALRLTSQRVCSASSQVSFTKHFRKKTIFLSDATSLQHLINMVGRSQHARELQHLDFLLTEDENMDTVTTDSIYQNVAAAFSALRRYLAKGTLDCLSIRLQDNAHLDKWKRNWEAVAGGWTVLMRSLTTSGLIIHKLDGFTESIGSISIDRVRPPVPLPALAQCFVQLRNLDISLSHTIKNALSGSNADTSEDSLEDVTNNSTQAVKKSQVYCNSLCDFVNLCPALQHLGLHWYRLTYFDTVQLLEQRKLLDYNVRECATPNLRSVSLRGIYTSEAVLLRLAEKSQLKSLEMINVHVENKDTFREFFDRITPNLDSIKLSDLWEKRRIDFEDSDQAQLSQEWIREGSSARQPVVYHQARGVKPNGEIEFVLKARKKRLEYGPPNGS